MSNKRSLRKNSNKSIKNRSRQRLRQQPFGGFPPPIKSQPKQTRCIRYSGTGASGTAVNFNMLDLLVSLSFAVTTTTYVSLFSSVRLNKISLYAVPTDSQVGYLSFGWRGTRTPYEETTMFYGGDFPSHQKFFPPEDSPAGEWFRGNSLGTDTVETVWTITNTGSANLIMDIEFTYILNDDVGWGNACTATTLNTVFASLLPRGGSLFVPVGLVNTQVT